MRGAAHREPEKSGSVTVEGEDRAVSEGKI